MSEESQIPQKAYKIDNEFSKILKKNLSTKKQEYCSNILLQMKEIVNSISSVNGKRKWGFHIAEISKLLALFEFLKGSLISESRVLNYLNLHSSHFYIFRKFERYSGTPWPELKEAFTESMKELSKIYKIRKENVPEKKEEDSLNSVNIDEKTGNVVLTITKKHVILYGTNDHKFAIKNLNAPYKIYENIVKKQKKSK